MNLTALLDGTAAVYNGWDTQVAAVTDRLDAVGKDTLFVCVEGKHTDGHRLARQALAKGACGIVCQRDLGLEKQIQVADTRKTLSLLACALYDHPSKKLQLIGITGTNGKTTTAHWIRDLLQADHKNTALIGTLGADLGNTQLATGCTTPDAADMNRLLQQSVQAGCTHAVAEISSQALDQKRCEGLLFSQAVFTNLSPEHLDYHGNMDRYASAKAALFEKAATAVVNRDDPYWPVIAKRCSGKVITCSLHGEADYVVKNISYKDGAVSYILLYKTDIARVQVLTPGMFSVYNSMIAIASCVQSGVDFYAACDSACKLQPVRGRMQRVIPDAPFAVYIDYAHTPAALQMSLQTVRDMTHGNVTVVFGCGGNRDRGKRPLMGKIAERYADFSVLTDDNPRTESSADILSEIAAGFGNKKHFALQADRFKAIETALRRANPGDCILIAGKGHEQTQIVGETVLSFDDADVVRQIWDALRK